MNDDFIKRFLAYKSEYLLKTGTFVAAQKEKLISDFSRHFKAMCEKLAHIHIKSGIDAVSYIEYTMLYTNFINRRYVAEVFVYGDDWYCDNNQLAIGEYDISQLFMYFDELWDKVLTLRKRYVGKVTAQEIAALMLNAIPEYFSYLTIIARLAIAEYLDKSELTGFAMNETLRINVGDYMANTEPVFIQSQSKDAKALINRFSEQHEYDYSYEDYSALDLSNNSFEKTNFRYAQFRNSVLINTSLHASSLIGATFRKANMENCRLFHCSINEADFTGAILKKANFVFADGRAGFLGENKRRHSVYLPVSFRYADLTDADFRWADLTGADFTGANLSGANFIGAILDGAIFEDCVGKKL